MKICPSFPGYSATKDGSIVSHRRRGVRIAGHGGTRSLIDYAHQYILSQFTTKKGYKTVCITQRNGKPRPIGVHQLVADAYHGKCPYGMQVRHLDGNPSNNNPHNLCYGTALQNSQDRSSHGRYFGGHQHHSSKLTMEQAQSIRSMRSAGAKVKELASKYDVSTSCIESIIYGKSYKNMSSRG